MFAWWQNLEDEIDKWFQKSKRMPMFLVEGIKL